MSHRRRRLTRLPVGRIIVAASIAIVAASPTGAQGTDSSDTAAEPHRGEAQAPEASEGAVGQDTAQELRGPERLLPIEPKSHPDPNILERSFLLPFLHGNIVEAQLAPHIFLWDNVDRLYQSPSQPGYRWGLGWSFTPMVRLRMLNDTSNPIKTLSWMPKTTLQYVLLRRHPSPLPNDQPTDSWTFHASVGHHSNGQDECTYAPGVLSREDLCPDPDRLEAVQVNYPNGNFSTNYLRFGVAKKWMTLTPTSSDSLAPTRSFLLSGSVEVNPSWLKIGGVLPPVLRDLYGCNRYGARAEWETRVGGFNTAIHSLLRGSLRLTGTVEYIDKLPPTTDPTFTSEPDAPLNALYDPATGSSRWRFAVETAWNPDALRGWGLMARYVHGQDYYNLLYIRDIHWFQLGIVFDAGEYQPFKR